MLAAGVLGGVRLARGMVLDRQVSYLFALLVVTVMLALLLVRRPKLRTRLGQHAPRHRRQTDAALGSSEVAAAATLAGADLALGLWAPAC